MNHAIECLDCSASNAEHNAAILEAEAARLRTMANDQRGAIAALKQMTPWNGAPNSAAIPLTRHQIAKEIGEKLATGAAQAAPPPTLGRIVHYTLTDHDADRINAEREKSRGTLTGNTALPGQVVTLLITAVHSETCINGRLLPDGNDSHWVTSVSRQEDGLPFVSGRWHWPARS